LSVPTRRNIAGGSPWEPKFGYSRAVRIGPCVLVAPDLIVEIEADAYIGEGT